MTRLMSNDVLGVSVCAMTYTSSCDAIIAAARSRRSLTVTALAVHGVMTGALNPGHRRRLNTLDMVLPDGQPIRWALNLLFRASLSDRVYGPNLMLHVCERAAAEGLSVAFYGNKQDVLRELRRNLLERFPALRIAVAMPSRFGRVGREEQAEIAKHLMVSGASIIFVGLGCPRQEIWLYENRERLAVPTIAVGAAFDFHAKQFAPLPLGCKTEGWSGFIACGASLVGCGAAIYC